ncbi:MAG: hypothetical protein QOD83_5019 [Solirubrobacteraceae bacterium]|jgi:hypothetical protein|nr:hypothetical protein [Solirubrobacteraceae bacterium]
MAKKSSRRLTDEERAEWRRQDRERLTQAARELLSSDGWTRWVRTRAMFHNYSAGNCLLLAAHAISATSFRPASGKGRTAHAAPAAASAHSPATYASTSWPRLAACRLQL